MQTYYPRQSGWHLDIDSSSDCCATCEFWTGCREQLSGLMGRDSNGDTVYGYVRIDSRETANCRAGYGQAGANQGKVFGCPFERWSQLYRN